jgi:hypothetical protein
LGARNSLEPRLQVKDNHCSTSEFRRERTHDTSTPVDAAAVYATRLLDAAAEEPS